MAGQAPAYWRPFLSGTLRRSDKPLPTPPFVLDQLPLTGAAAESIPLELGDGISPPVLISTPDPGYTPEARAAHCSGSVALLLVVDTDGAVKYVALLKPLGLGLDDAAARAVLGWRFKPATQDGLPVAVKLTVDDLHFNIF